MRRAGRREKTGVGEKVTWEQEKRSGEGSRKKSGEKTRRWSHRKTEGRKEVQNNQSRLESILTYVSGPQMTKKERIRVIKTLHSPKIYH